jgi:hypothetical protein
MKKNLANVSRSLPGAKFGMFALALLVLQVSFASATPINRGSFVGTNVIYADVIEESATDPALVQPGPLGGLFGEPTVAGDSLDFNPKGFAATSSNGGIPDQTDSNLQFMVVAKPGKAVSSIAFTERGDTTLSGLSGDAFTSVSATIFVEISEVDGVPTDINIPSVSMLFTPSGGTYLLSADGVGPIYQTDWEGSAFIDIGPFLPFGANATKVSVSLDNTLVALSQTGTTAFIQKKDFDGVTITVETNDIPEPTSIALAVLCLSLMTTQRRR